MCRKPERKRSLRKTLIETGGHGLDLFSPRKKTMADTCEYDANGRPGIP
jgi:hypothetical protein